MSNDANQPDARLRAFLEVMPGAIAYVSKLGEVQAATSDALEFLGMSYDTVTSRYVHDWAPVTIHEDGRPCPVDEYPVIRVLATGERHGPVTLGVRRPDGETRWGVFQAVPVRDPATGELQGACVSFADITEPRRAVVVTEASERRLRQIIDHLFGFVGLYDLDGVLIEANRAPLEVAGLGRADVLGKPFWDTYWWSYDPEVQARLRDVMGRAGCGETVRYREKVRVRGGDLIDCELAFGPMRDDDGTIDGIIGFGVDVTERAEAERALRENGERLRLALEASAQSTWELDLVARTATFDARHALILGYRRDELRTENEETFTSRLHPDDREATFAAFRAHMEGESPICAVEFRLRTKSGAYKWIQGTGRIVDWDAAGAPVRMIGTHTDIDARKQIEEELRTLNAELERRVEKRTSELEALNEELEDFAYSVSHDLRTPLRAINGFSAILRQDLAPGLDPGSLKLLDRIQAAASRMGSLIDDLLDLAKGVEPSTEVRTVDLDAEVRALVEELRLRLTGNVPVFRVGRLGTAETSPSIVRVVLRELLDNASKYTAGELEPSVEVGSVEGASPATYFVRDNGVGFSPTHAERLFTPFARLHSDSQFDGRGMGLAKVRRALRRTGGRIWAESEPGVGATFYFTLGSQRPSQPAPPP